MQVINLQPSGTYFLFCHSLDANRGQARYYTRAALGEKQRSWYLLPHSVVTFNFPDAALNPRKSTATVTTFGQGKELHCITNILQQATEGPCADRSCVMIGVSRGAVAALNYCALFKPATVRALILESPFDHIDNAVQQRTKTSYFSWIPGGKYIGNALFDYLYPAHNRQGIQPIDVAPKLPRNLPILLVHAKNDSIVPFSCAENLVNQLKKSGHTNLYFLPMQDGNHAHLNTGAQATLYQEVTHAFLATFGLAHDPILAAAGMPQLATFKVTATP